MCMWSMRGKYLIGFWGKYLGVHGEYDKVGVFTLHKIDSAENIKRITETGSIKRKWRICKGILQHSPIVVGQET